MFNSEISSSKPLHVMPLTKGERLDRHIMLYTHKLPRMIHTAINNQYCD